MATYSMKKPKQQPGLHPLLPKVTVRQDTPNPNKAAVYSMAPKAPAAPKAPSATSTAAAPVVAPPPPHTLADDAQAAAARAQAIFDATQKRAALQAAGTYDATDLAEAIRRLETQRPQDETQAKNAANAAGLASSGYVVNNLNNIATQYTRSEGDARSAYDRRESERAAQLGDLNSQGLLSDAAITAALEERQAQRDQAAAAAGALAGNPDAGSHYSMTDGKAAGSGAAGAAGGITRGPVLSIGAQQPGKITTLPKTTVRQDTNPNKGSAYSMAVDDAIRRKSKKKAGR